MYAIVRSGGRQHKVAVGDIVEVDRISTGKVGDTVELSTLLVVDGDAVTSDPWVLAGIKVQAEIVDHHKGDEDRHPALQEQDRLPPSSGPPPAVHGDQGHRHPRGCEVRD